MQSQPAASLLRLAPALTETCSEYLRDYRQEYAKAVEKGESSVGAAAAFSRSLDGVLGALFCATEAAARQRVGAPTRVCLAAVGGFGRGLVGLRSDVDLLFLCEDPESPYVQALAEGMLYPLWDLDLEVGHAVRGDKETLALAVEDVRTATTLLDLRPIAGDRSLASDLRKRARRRVFSPRLKDFVNALESDMHQRHTRAGDWLHLLEPDLKFSRGGLRDLDIAMWAACARWRVSSIAELLTKGVLQRRDVDDLHAAQEFHWRVRNHLHLRNRRRQDRLTFADQEDIAESMGFLDGITLAVEQFMQTYYRHAGVIAHAAERMLSRARDVGRKNRVALRRIGDGLAYFDGALTFERTDDVQNEPLLALRLYEEVLREKKPAYGFAREAVVRATNDPAWCEALRSHPESGPRFTRLLTATEKSGVPRGSLPEELHRVGLTTALVPELEALVGRVVHDLFHVYTFDVHAVKAVDRLRALRRGKRFEHLGLASRLAAESPRPRPLHIAAFLHVLGKIGGHRGDDAAVQAAPIVQRLGLSEVDRNHVLWLLEERRTFYDWATRRDTSDPAVIAELAERIGSRQRLRDLYLLTVAVLSTTNPTAMTSWKARVLDDLYFALVIAIEGEMTPSRVDALRQHVAVGFVGDEGEVALREFVRALPDRYLLANDADAIRRHARLARDGGDFALGLGPGPSDGVSELVLWTRDRSGLLADVCAALTSRRVGVVGAQVYTAGAMALDVFWVRRAPGGKARDGEGSRLDQRLRDRLDDDLRRLEAGTLTTSEAIARVPAPPSWSVKHQPRVPTFISIDNLVSKHHSVIDVFTEDRVGVLHRIAHTLREQGLTIELAKVNTEGARVADVFYVRDEHGQKLEDPQRVAAVKQALEAALAEL